MSSTNTPALQLSTEPANAQAGPSSFRFILHPVVGVWGRPLATLPPAPKYAYDAQKDDEVDMEITRSIALEKKGVNVEVVNEKITEGKDTVISAPPQAYMPSRGDSPPPLYRYDEVFLGMPLVGKKKGRASWSSDASSTMATLPPYAPPGHMVVESKERPGEFDTIEPKTLARSLFKYGFLFPPFWLIGAFIMCSSLKPPPSWEETKTEAERKVLVAELRAVELKWSKRCLLAFLLLILFITVPSVIIVLVA